MSSILKSRSRSANIKPLNLFFLFLIFPSSGFAVIADANIIEHIRQMKADELAVLRVELDSIPQQIRQCRYAPIVSDKQRPFYDNSPDKPKRRNDRRPPKMTFKSQKEKLEALDELKKKPAKLQQNIAAIEANDLNCLFPVFTLPFSVGQIGRLGDNTYGGYMQEFTHRQRFKIISIIDENDALVEFEISSYFTRWNDLGMGVGPGRMITETIWLRGISTVDLITGSNLRPKGPFIISGTTDYLTPNHAQFTVYVFEPLEIPDSI